MGVRAADLRLLLPTLPERVAVDAALAEWREAYRALGALVEDAGDADAVAARPDALAGMLAGRPGAALVPSARADDMLEAAGYEATRILVRPGREGPRLALPAGNRAVATYLFRVLRPAGDRRARLKASAYAWMVGRGSVPAPAVLTLGALTPGPPFALGPEGFDVDARGGWLAWFGDGDDLQRIVLQAFPEGADAPQTVVKLARRPRDDGPFVADERGLDLVHRLAPHAAHRAPRFLGRRTIAGLPASAETAAPGPPLNEVLDARGDVDGKLALIHQVADWIVALGVESAAGPEALLPELDRLTREVLPAWEDHGVPGDVARRLPPVRAVLAHRDPGSWNMTVDAGRVAVLDWESAVFPSLPLWDLAYFLADAYASLDGPAAPEVKVERMLRLLRGDTKHSASVLRRIRDAADAMAVPREAIGPIVTLGWLHHGRSHLVRAARTDGGEVEVGLLNRVAEPWLADPLLGVEWTAFARVTG